MSELPDPNEILRSVSAALLGRGGQPTRRKRQPPHRCFNKECGRVTKHVFCPSCQAERSVRRPW